MSSNNRISPEVILGGAFVACGLLVLVVGSFVARGGGLVASLLCGLFLTLLGAGMLALVLPPSAPDDLDEVAPSPAPQPVSEPAAAIDPPAAAPEPVEPAGESATDEEEREVEPEEAQEPDSVEETPPVDEPAAEPEEASAEDDPADEAPAVEKRQCSATTKSGSQCRMMTDDPSGLCHVHRKQGSSG